PFAGVIDGQRHFFKVIASINKDVEGAALFRTVSGATIKNLYVEGSVIGGAASGGIVGQAVDGVTTMENCVFNGAVTAMSGEPAGNLIAGNVASGATVTYNNCLDATNLLWPATGTRAYSVTGVDATLTLTGTTGIAWNNAIYAPEGATVEFTMTTLTSANYVATDGTMTKSNGTYSLVMPAQNVTILPEYAMTYAINSNISAGGTVEINKAEAGAGVNVCVTITPDPNYMLGELTVTDADGGEIAMTMYDGGFGYFTMPNKTVTVTVTFNKRYSFENGELRLLIGDFNTLASGNNGFGTDVTGNKGDVLKVTAAEGVRFTSICDGLFQNFTNCTEIDLSKVNTSAMTHTSSMFKGCTSLRELNMTGWNLLQVEDMESMFENCSSLRELDLSGINMNTSASMTEMFSCEGTNTGVCKLTLPAGMGVTESMHLNKGYYSGYYDGAYHNSGWQLLGNKSVVSGLAQDNGITYATLPSQPATATFVWSKMPDDFVLELPDGQDNSAVVEAWDGVTTNVKLTGRTLYHDGDWNTLCLPFTLSNALDASYPVLSGATLMVLDTETMYNEQGQEYFGGDEQDIADYTIQTGFDEATGTLNLFFKDGDFEAGTPLIAKWDSGEDIVSPVFSDVTINKTMYPAVSQDGKVTFVGQYSPIKVTEPNRYIMLSSGNTLGYAAAGNTLRPFRAHFEVTSGQNVKGYQISFGEEDPSIIHNSQFIIHNNDDAWYSLDGIKLHGKPTRKGIYIHNGRRIVVK
ncbi:MAG: BspA family leucine-rich repeat surface protein, partial [Bacteroidaceae bacterium]|nr:BspA family leucine-rich repeat surface protein [Bacteroidaceae bacterium]